MSEHFNGLAPDELERLAILAEELGECVQAINKIIRHGYSSYHPVTGVINRDALAEELGHVFAAGTWLITSGDLLREDVDKAVVCKAEKVKRWTHHQD